MTGPQVDGEFAGYRVIRRLGAGGMGQVWLVENPDLQRSEAMKVVTIDGADPQFAQRFTLEARTAAGLDHPNIVTVYGYGVVGDIAWFTMSYLEGSDLTAVGALPPTEVAVIIGRVADALDYANSRDVIHRDVKPANIIVRRDTAGRIDRVTVLDFGIAKLLGATNLTATNAFIGTVSYAPPESLTGGVVGPPADQYSLAATAFQLLTGRPPFTGDAPAAVMMAHITGPVPLASSLSPRLAPVDAVLRRALAKEPTHRFPTCRDFANALGQQLGLIDGPPPASLPPASATADPHAALTESPRADAAPTVVPRQEAIADETIRRRAAAEDVPTVIRNPEAETRTRTTRHGRRSGTTAVVIGVILVLAVASGIYAFTSGSEPARTANSPTSVFPSTTPVTATSAAVGPTRSLGATSLGAGFGGFCAAAVGGAGYCWGSTGLPAVVPNVGPVDSIAMAGSSGGGCAVSRGDLYCWGTDASIPTTSGPAASRDTPSKVGGIAGARAVSLGLASGCVATADGVYCWGGTSSNASKLPTKVPGVPAASTVSVGNPNACALSDGDVWCWGALISNTPAARVAGLGPATALSSGAAVTCAVSSNALYCWGSEVAVSGTRLTGKGTESPVQMPEFGSVTAVAVAENPSARQGNAPNQGVICAISRGKVLCAGGTQSHLSSGDSVTTIPGIDGATTVAIARTAACAGTPANTYCWGDSGLGRTSAGPSSAPVQYPAG